MKTSSTTAILLTSTAAAVSGFVVVPQCSSSSSSSSRVNNNFLPSTTKINGLFDGVKEAFSAPPTQLDSERETPIDRWMGWSVVSENVSSDATTTTPTDFVDSMDEKNYVAVELSKPMGIIFEENDSEYGGIFVQSLKAGGVAAENGTLKSGDQLVAVGTKNVSGMDFDDALGAITESDGATTKLTLFRGSAKQFYGPTGPSKEWLTNFCDKGGVDPQ